MGYGIRPHYVPVLCSRQVNCVHSAPLSSKDSYQGYDGMALLPKVSAIGMTLLTVILSAPLSRALTRVSGRTASFAMP
ncbi:hypothetical protein XAP6164_90009 [Xanthomonas phaseoli pv. phaseoli]|nr:hypothetical protein XAP6164_90009 [Xanthomonas phaseoli pv. phaseoli]